MSDAASVIVALATLANTGLLVWAQFKLRGIHQDVNGAKDAAVDAAHAAGVIAGQAGQHGRALD